MVLDESFMYRLYITSMDTLGINVLKNLRHEFDHAVEQCLITLHRTRIKLANYAVVTVQHAQQFDQLLAQRERKRTPECRLIKWYRSGGGNMRRHRIFHRVYIATKPPDSLPCDAGEKDQWTGVCCLHHHKYLVQFHRPFALIEISTQPPKQYMDCKSTGHHLRSTNSFFGCTIVLRSGRTTFKQKLFCFLKEFFKYQQKSKKVGRV